jgi:hypothetical protein
MLSTLMYILLGVAALLVIALVAVLLWPRDERHPSQRTGIETGDAGVSPATPFGGITLPTAALMGLIGARKGCGLLGGVAFGLLFVVIGGVVGFFGVQTFQNAQASVDWSSARGQVTESRVGTHDSDGTTMYSAEVVYEYTVNGRNYINNRIKFGEGSTSNPRPAHNTVAQYPVGASVDVYYHPDDPLNAVLEPGTAGLGVWALPGMGGCFALAGLLAIGGSVIGVLRGGVG